MTEEQARAIVSTQGSRAGFIFRVAFENKTDVLKVMCMMSDRIRELEQDLRRFKEREQEGLRAARRATELPYCPV